MKATKSICKKWIIAIIAIIVICTFIMFEVYLELLENSGSTDSNHILIYFKDTASEEEIYKLINNYDAEYDLDLNSVDRSCILTFSNALTSTEQKKYLLELNLSSIVDEASTFKDEYIDVKFKDTDMRSQLD
jgi:hypothetical protein